MSLQEHFDNTLQKKLTDRKTNGLLRVLSCADNGVDFCSNDYLGLARSATIRDIAENNDLPVGATGSRLISGNSKQAEEVEKKIAAFHGAAAALIFTSGYTANVGLLSFIASRGDLLILDAYCHASLIDGAGLSHAARLKFKHNDLDDLRKKLQRPANIKFVVVESVYSMHGDEAPLKEIVALCAHYSALLIVDEAHTTGIYGRKGEGLVCQYGLQDNVYARIHTFGKALGLHGAAVVGSTVLRECLINYSRPFIYTTALPPIAYLHIDKVYDLLPSSNRQFLTQLTDYFQSTVKALKISSFVTNPSPIQGIVVGGNSRTRSLAKKLSENGFFTKAILSPTVPRGEERIRICLHTFNTTEEIDALLNIVKKEMR